MKRLISLMLAFAMFFGVLPVGEMVAFAEEEEPEVRKIKITKTYKTLEDLGELQILIEGKKLSNLEVQIIGENGRLEFIDKAPASGDRIAQYYLDASKAGADIYIEGEPYSIEEDVIPRITSKTPSNGTIDTKGTIRLDGSNISKLTETEKEEPKNYIIKSYFTEGTNPIPLVPNDDVKTDDGIYIKKEWGTEIGNFNLVFERSYINEESEKKIPVEVKHVYGSIVTTQGELEVSKDIDMFPTQGARESEVTLEADMLIKDLSIFLLKNKNDEYTKENMVLNNSIKFKKGKEGEKDSIKFMVPKGIELGSKHVILTNKVDPSKEISNQVNKYKELKNLDGGTLFFTVIDGKNSVKLDSVQPFESSTKGIKAVLVGERIVRLSDNLYKGGEPSVDISDNSKMVVTYEGGSYDKESVTKLTREITLIIGNKATFREGSNYSGDTYDRVEIVVPEVEDVEKTIQKDVHIEIRDTIEFDNGRKIEVIEKDILENGFTFHPKKVTPEISKGKIFPDTIMVNYENNEYRVVEDTIISIQGKKFLKYIYSDGENTKIKNPIISIANQDGSKEWFDYENIRVLKGKMDIDEVKGAHEGDEIRISIKKGSKIPESIVSDDGSKVQFLKLTNPLRTEADDDEAGPYATGEIKFRRELPNRKPLIDRVNPEVVITSKGEKITITGANFANNIKLYIDGEIESSSKRISDTEIEFTAPRNKKPGKYQIRVDNISDSGEEIVGYTVTMDFRYIITGSNPQITEFNPKEGSNGTRVYMTGKGFKSPLETTITSTTDGDEVRKFIGTTVLFRKSGTNEDYEDMNDYYKPNGKLIELQEYKSKKDIIEYKDGGLELEDYHYSVIFEDENGKYYRIYKSTKTGDIVLETGLDKDNNKDTYTLKYNLSTKYIEAKGKGDTQKVTVTDHGISFGDLKLMMKTPYIKNKEDNEIVGNKVKVSDDGKSLNFTVNLKSDDPDKIIQNGEYDVIVKNPDHEEVVAKDKFEYIANPESKPMITGIDSMEEGSAFGKSLRTIKGVDFREGIRVFVGEKEIPSEDIIYINSKEVRVIIPKYDGVIGTDTDHGRKETVITVLNSDGGNSNHKFIYINPNGNPKIDSISPNFGALTGETEVTIYEATGKDVERGFSFIEYAPSKEYDELIDLTKEDERNKLGGNNKAEAMKKDPSGEDWKKQLEILPKVYFGGEEAEIIEYDTIGINPTGKRTITVLTPKGQGGKVKVQLENNNTGVSNEVDFEYRAISIGNIVIKPERGTKIGKNSAEIRPSDIKQKPFVESEINIYQEDKTLKKDKKLQLVRFGNENDLNITNKNIDGSMENAYSENSGRIVNNQAKIKVGNLEVIYKIGSDKNTLNFELKSKVYDSKKEEYEDATFELRDLEFPEDETAVYLPINILEEKDNKGKKYNGFELIKIYKTRFTGSDGLNNMGRIVVERGYSPDAKVMESGGYIDLKVPSYYSIGEVEVKVINADGGDAKTKYIYTNPANSPVITDAYREGNPTTDEEIEAKEKVIRVDYKGGVNIHIKGKDFRKPSSIDIGDRVNIQGEDILHLPQVTDREDYEELMFTMPAVPEDYVGKRYSFIVTTPFEAGDNYNSATTSSADGEFKIYVEFTKGETNPKITKLDPNQGPSTGGNEVIIEGEDFREKDPEKGLYGELRVFVGDKEVTKNDIEYINSKKLKIIMPAHTPGTGKTVKIKVENPDGTIAVVEGNNDQYTYVSNPKINEILDKKGNKKQTLFIDGGEEITIKGQDFINDPQDPRVIFNPVLKEASENPETNGESVFIEDRKGEISEYILESGTPGTDVEFVDSTTIKVKTPAGKLDTGGVIVINPDDAATLEYDIKYTMEDIDHPKDVRASLIQDEYIRINWNEVIDKATTDDGKTVQYEVYVVQGNSRQLIGSTGSTGFVFRDLKPNTTYKFLVRAVGKYGSSKPIDESMSNEVKTGSKSGPKDEDGKPGENTTADKSGDTANVVIGDDAFKNSNEYVIDLTRGTLAGTDKVVVRISAKVVAKEKSNKIKIVGKDYSLSFVPNVFENSTITSNKGNPNAGVKFEVSPVNTNFELSQNQGDTILSSKYLLRGRIFVGGSSNEVEGLNGKMNLILDYDENMANTRRIKTENIKLVKYDAYDRRFKEVFGNKSSYGTSIGDLDELGTYIITGSRR